MDSLNPHSLDPKSTFLDSVRFLTKFLVFQSKTRGCAEAVEPLIQNFTQVLGRLRHDLGVARQRYVEISFRFALFSLVGILAACGQKPVESAGDPAVAAMASEAREVSLQWLSVAAANASTPELQTRIQAVKDSLETSDLRSPPAVYAKTCSSDSTSFVAAFVSEDSHTSNPDIYVCAHSSRFGKYFLAQVLIHEAIHLTGVREECATTQLEMNIMSDAFETPFENSYVSRCGLSAN